MFYVCIFVVALLCCLPLLHYNYTLPYPHHFFFVFPFTILFDDILQEEINKKRTNFGYKCIFGSHYVPLPRDLLSSRIMDSLYDLSSIFCYLILQYLIGYTLHCFLPRHMDIDEHSGFGLRRLSTCILFTGCRSTCLSVGD